MFVHVFNLSTEYIGDDITEIQISVKRALQSCCQQLRSQLTKRNALRDALQRKNRLVKYIPDATRSIFGMLDTLRKRKAEEAEGEVRVASPRKLARRPGETERIDSENASIIQQLNNGVITEDVIRACLAEAIEAQQVSIDGADHGNGEDKANSKVSDAQPTFLVPIQNLDDNSSDIHHEFFVFRPMHGNSLE